MIEYALFKSRPLLNVDESRDSKYSAFRRYDIHHWKRARLYLAAPILLPRFVVSLSWVIIGYLIVKAININVREGDMPSETQMRLSMSTIKFLKRCIAFTGAGIYYYSMEKVNVNYSEFLGPDWKPTERVPSTFICNHCSWMDIVMAWSIKEYPIFVSKIGIKKYPLVGYFVQYPAYESIFVNRAGTKEEREEVVKITG